MPAPKPSETDAITRRRTKTAKKLEPKPQPVDDEEDDLRVIPPEVVS